MPLELRFCGKDVDSIKEERPVNDVKFYAACHLIPQLHNEAMMVDIIIIVAIYNMTKSLPTHVIFSQNSVGLSSVSRQWRRCQLTPAMTS